MTENLKQFLLAVAEDKEWIQWVNALAGRQEAIQAAIAKAAELDLDLSAADFDAPEGTLSEDELANVAGGGCSCTFAGLGVLPDGPEVPDFPDHLPFFSTDPEWQD